MDALVFLLFLLVAVGVYSYTKRQVTLKQRKKCPNCGSVATQSDKTCAQCGTDLS